MAEERQRPGPLAGVERSDRARRRVHPAAHGLRLVILLPMLLASLGCGVKRRPEPPTEQLPRAHAIEGVQR